MIRNLKKLRIEAGISQQQLAGVLGVSQQSVNKYENHNVEPEISILIAMADYFGTTVDYLVGRISDKTEDALQHDVLALTETEVGLIKRYRVLSREEKLCVTTLIETYEKLK